MSATVSTIGVKYDTNLGFAMEANLHGVPYGAAASHDPAYTPNVIPILFGNGLGVQPLSQPLHLFSEDHVLAELEDVPDVDFQVYKLIVAALARPVKGTGQTVALSPMGQSTYTSSGWTLVSTTAGWVETAFKRWAGVLELIKKGAAY